MNIGVDFPAFLQNNSLCELSETIAKKIDALLYDILRPLKHDPPSLMKLKSSLSESHIELLISTLYCDIVSRLQGLADARLHHAKTREEAKSTAQANLQIVPISVPLPNEIVFHIVSLASAYNASPLQQGKYVNIPSKYLQIPKVYDWTKHRLYPSYPAVVYIDNNTSKRAVRRSLLCKGFNFDVRIHDKSPSGTIPMLLEYPERWKRLELQIHRAGFLVFLNRFSAVIPYLDQLTFSMDDTYEDRGPYLEQIRQVKWKGSGRLQKATLPISLLNPMVRIGLFHSVKLLSISLPPKNSMLHSLQLLSNLPCLEDLELHGFGVNSPNNETVDPLPQFPRLRSVHIIGADLPLLSYFLLFLKNAKVTELEIATIRNGTNPKLTRDTARSIHSAFPGLVGLNVDCPYDVAFLGALSEHNASRISLLPCLRNLMLQKDVPSVAKDALLKLIKARRIASIPLASLQMHSLPQDPLLHFELERLVPSLRVIESSSRQIDGDYDDVSSMSFGSFDSVDDMYLANNNRNYLY